MKTPTNKLRTIIAGLLVVGLIMALPVGVKALIPPPGPGSGSVGVEGTIGSPAPTQAATIVSPANGQTFSSIPVTVTGFCPKGVLVKIFSNNIFVGSTMCVNNSYSLKVALFSGRNDLIARVYDSLDQQGPDSNKVTVTYRDAEFQQFGSHVVLTSEYARRGANPGETLTWPIVLSGGVGPYAISVDWGDGKPPELLSASFPGVINITHIYDSAGTYNVVVKAVDKNGTTAFLQVVGVANGEAKQSGSTSNGDKDQTVIVRILWWPLIVLAVLVIVSFWLGRRYELTALRKKIEDTRF